VVDVQYQISFGVTFLIRYLGLDKMTGVVARVNVDLKLQATLLGFSVMCVGGELCVGEVGERLFYGVEGLIKTHPELLDYSLISLDIEEAAGGKVLAMVGFELPAMRLRVLSDLKI
jgi:hypothetical protein